jgi:hypothetical protein
MKTLTFSEENKGWTSFKLCSRWYVQIDNRFYSIKNGQLYLHNNIDNKVPNTFMSLLTK